MPNNIVIHNIWLFYYDVKFKLYSNFKPNIDVCMLMGNPLYIQNSNRRTQSELHNIRKRIRVRSSIMNENASSDNDTDLIEYLRTALPDRSEIKNSTIKTLKTDKKVVFTEYTATQNNIRQIAKNGIFKVYCN